MMDDDVTQLKAIQNLDQESLVAVFDHYAPIVYKYALRLCGNPAEADDVVGDVFAELLKQLSKGKGPRDNLKSYIFQIAYHKIVDHARERKHLVNIDDIKSLSSGDALHSQNEHREQMHAMEDIIQNFLTEDQRHVILLRFFEDFNLKETAKILGKNVNNVKVLQNRAIAKLRKEMNQQSKEVL